MHVFGFGRSTTDRKTPSKLSIHGTLSVLIGAIKNTLSPKSSASTESPTLSSISSELNEKIEYDSKVLSGDFSIHLVEGSSLPRNFNERIGLNKDKESEDFQVVTPNYELIPERYYEQFKSKRLEDLSDFKFSQRHKKHAMLEIKSKNRDREYVLHQRWKMKLIEQQELHKIINQTRAKKRKDSSPEPLNHTESGPVFIHFQDSRELNTKDERAEVLQRLKAPIVELEHSFFERIIVKRDSPELKGKKISESIIITGARKMSRNSTNSHVNLSKCIKLIPPKQQYLDDNILYTEFLKMSKVSFAVPNIN